MTKDRKIEADKIHIRSIKTLRGNIDSPIDMEIDVDEVKGHRFGFDLRTALMTKLRSVGLRLQVDITAQDGDLEDLPITGSYTHEILFEVENLDDFIEVEEGREWIEASLGSTLVSILFSTIRGIIYSRTQGTSLGVVVLPVVAPLRLMNFDPAIIEQVSTVQPMKKKIKKKTEK